MPPKSRNTDTITFSLPPEMAQHLRQVVKEEDRTVSELLREAIRLYMEEREWRRRERLERLPVEPDRRDTTRQKEERLMNDLLDLIPAALYARVSRDRQDVDLSVAAQLRALRDYAERHGYLVAREYVDEAESGRTANRPQFRRMLDEAAKPEAPFKPDSRLEVLKVYQEAGARRRLQGHAPAQGHQGGIHHRARR